LEYLKGNKLIKPVKSPECTCFNCLKETEVHTIEIPQMGYGSRFDGLSTRIQLCDKCYNQTNPEWWKLEVIPTVQAEELNDDLSEYKYENEIFEFIKQIPLASQELFWNHFAYGASANFKLESQDWIDCELGILSDEKCEEYGLA
jgi:hypothetical protein